MDKQSNQNIPCTWCDRPALPNTDPPACEVHQKDPPKYQEKTASEHPLTLKELDNVK